MSKPIVWEGWAPKWMVVKAGRGRKWERSTICGKTMLQGLSDDAVRVMHNLSVSRKELWPEDQQDAVRVRVTMEVIEGE